MKREFLFRDVFHPAMVRELSSRLKAAWPDFDTKRFTRGVLQDFNKLARHALRTLLKQGHTGALTFLGFHRVKADLVNWQISADRIRPGDKLDFRASLRETAGRDHKLLLQYRIFFQKAGGKSSPKVFYLGEKTLAAHQSLEIRKTHHFRVYKNQRLYPGDHRVELLINGKKITGLDFEIIGLQHGSAPNQATGRLVISG